MSIWKAIINNLPEVEGPSQKFLPFKEKLKWTLIVLVIFFVLGIMPLFVVVVLWHANISKPKPREATDDSF